MHNIQEENSTIIMEKIINTMIPFGRGNSTTY